MSTSDLLEKELLEKEEDNERLWQECLDSILLFKEATEFDDNMNEHMENSEKYEGPTSIKIDGDFIVFHYK